jgi:hypothetical protein
MIDRLVAWVLPRSLLVDDVLTMRDERDEARRLEAKGHQRTLRALDALEAERAKGAELAALVVDLAATLDALMEIEDIEDTAPREQAGGGGMGHRNGPQGENRNG